MRLLLLLIALLPCLALEAGEATSLPAVVSTPLSAWTAAQDTKARKKALDGLYQALRKPDAAVRAAAPAMRTDLQAVMDIVLSDEALFDAGVRFAGRFAALYPDSWDRVLAAAQGKAVAGRRIAACLLLNYPGKDKEGMAQLERMAGKDADVETRSNAIGEMCSGDLPAGQQEAALRILLTMAGDSDADVRQALFRGLWDAAVKWDKGMLSARLTETAAVVERAFGDKDAGVRSAAALAWACLPWRELDPRVSPPGRPC
jgi:hypothetical protein